jgi:multiple antibiotic resistance protein
MMAPFVDSFVTTLVALFPIVNPPGTAFLFFAATRYGSRSQRVEVAGRVALYSFVIITGSLYIGAFVLQLFGISIPVLRIGGGIVVAMTGWRMLNADRERNVEHHSEPNRPDILGQAFYQLTMPMTAGPGTIAVTIALGAGRDHAAGSTLPFVLAAFAATALIAGLIYVCYRFADRMESALGANASDAIARLFAFILLCLGIEIFWSGLSALIAGLGRI